MTSTIVATPISIAEDNESRVLKSSSATKLEALGDKVAGVALAVFLGLITLTIVIPLAIWAVSAIVKWRQGPSEHDNFLQDLGKNRLTALRQALTSSSKCLALNRAALKDPQYQQNLLKLIDLIEQEPPKGQSHQHCQKIRRSLHRLLASPHYEQRKTREDFADIHLLHQLAIALTFKADGMGVVREFGKNLGTQLCQTLQAEDFPTKEAYLNAKLNRIFLRSRHQRRETLVNKVWWSFLHPQKTLHTLVFSQDTMFEGAKYYNPYEFGNAAIFAGNYSISKSKVAFSFAPTPTADHVLEAAIQGMENTSQKKQRHAFLCLENAGQPGERVRRQQKLEMAKRHLNAMELASMPMDGPAWKLSGDFKPFRNTFSISGYYAALHAFVCGPDGKNYKEIQDNPKHDNGFYLPRADEASLQTTKDSVEQAMVEITQRNTAWKQLSSMNGKQDTARQGKVCLLSYELFLAMEHIVHLAKALRPDEIKESLDQQLEGTLLQACKQDVDRGIVMNVMTRLAFEALSGREITEETVNEVIGQVFGRAFMIDQRLILRNRFEALSDWIAVIFDNPDSKAYFFTTLWQYLGDRHQDPLTFSFTPSDTIA